MDPESEMELALRQSEAEMSRPATPPEAYTIRQQLYRLTNRLNETEQSDD